MSQEARTIRPFLGLEIADGLFGGSSVMFGPDRCLSDDSISLAIDPEEYGRRPVVLEWSAEDQFESFQRRLQAVPGATGIPMEALRLLVTASTGYLKKTEVVLSLGLEDAELRHRHSLGDDPRPGPFLAGHHGSSVDAYLLLGREIERQPLRPWRKGTWLAHTRFGLSTTTSQAMFRPTPLTKETRDDLGLDGRTMRYFDLGDHDPLEPYVDQSDEPRFYVDDQFLAELSANPTGPTSTTLQLQLALDFMSSVINECARRREALESLSFADIEDSLLGRVLRVAAGPGARERDMQSLLSRVRTEPAKATARAEHSVDLQKALVGVFHGDAK
jgi:hypothetical protein